MILPQIETRGTRSELAIRKKTFLYTDSIVGYNLINDSATVSFRRNATIQLTHEIVEAVLDANGQLRLKHAPRMSPGSVQRTIRPLSAPKRGLADVVREIAAEQRARGFAGRSASEMHKEEDTRLAEEVERDQELDAARGHSSGSP